MTFSTPSFFLEHYWWAVLLGGVAAFAYFYSRRQQRRFRWDMVRCIVVGDVVVTLAALAPHAANLALPHRPGAGWDAMKPTLAGLGAFLPVFSLCIVGVIVVWRILTASSRVPTAKV